MNGLLAGVRVLDLSIWRPGPYATQLLAEMGAEVIKVEPPGGDPMRVYPELFASLNADKRSIVLDLKSEDGRARALELAAEADVVIEGFRPGVAARLGVGRRRGPGREPVGRLLLAVRAWARTARSRSPRATTSTTRRGPARSRPTAARRSSPAVPIADLAGGMAAAMAICAAVVRQLRTGEGERIDVAMTDVLATWTGAATTGPRTTTTDGPGRRRRARLRHVRDRRRPARRARRADRGPLLAVLCDVLGLDRRP